MSNLLRFALGLSGALCIAAAPVRAQDRVESESRDAVLGRTETPQNFVRVRQTRNAGYLLGVNAYMEKRLAEIAAAHGEARRDARLQAWIVEASARADESWGEILGSGERPLICRRSIGLIEAGAFDVNVRSPMSGEIEARVQWAAR